MSDTRVHVPLAAIGVLSGVVEAAAPGGPLRVRSPFLGTVEAHLALPGVALEAGERVLVSLDPTGCAYVVGVLDRPARAADGSSARVEPDGALSVRDAEGALVFERRDGKSIVHAAEGSIAFRAAGTIDLEAELGVRIRSGREVRLEVAPPGGEPRTSVRLGRRAIEVASRVLGASVSSAVLDVGEGLVRAKVMQTEGGTLRQSFERIETNAGHLFERARETYREVETLAQTRAGRLRVIARDTVHLLSKHTLVKADEDVKIKGEKIYLS